MISAKQPITTDSPASETELGVGARLQRARELRGLRIAEVAARLRVSERLIRALEQEDRKALPAAVYVRGYLCHYARLLGLAPEALIAAYPLSVASAPERAVCVQPILVESVAWQRAALWQGMNVFILALVFGLPLVWWYGEIPRWLAEEHIAEVAPASAVERGLSGSQMPDQSVFMTPPAVAPVVQEVPVNVSPMLTPTLLALGAQSLTQTPPPVLTDNLGLKLTVTAKSQIEVRDAKGVSLLKGQFKAGTRRTLTEGALPLSVSFKPATAVRLSYNGQPVLAPPGAKPGQRVHVQVGRQP